MAGDRPGGSCHRMAPDAVHWRRGPVSRAAGDARAVALANSFPAMTPHTGLRRAALLGAALLLPALAIDARAQAPGTDIYVLPLHEGASGVGAPRNLTRRVGYDNQPSFAPGDSVLLYTSIREDGQADIWRVPVAGGTPARLTSTPESEYSPQVAPVTNLLSTVRVERDSTQRLWWFQVRMRRDARGATRADTVPEPLVPGLAPVGYYAFVTPQQVAAFVLGDPPTLQVAQTGRNAPSARVVARDIGRSIHAVPGRAGTVSFVQKGPDGWWITALHVGADGRSDRLWRIAPTLPGVEDYAWAGRDVLLAARGSALYRWRVGRDTAWTPVADLASSGIRGITRLAVSGDGRMLALVAQDADAPGAAAVPAEIAEAWQDLAVLSADSLLGRATGTPGERKAARYLAERFAAAGLEPAGDEGSFLQRVPIAVRATPDDPRGRRQQVRALPGFAIPAELEGARLDTATNVIGFIRGADPALRDEVILVTAHFDHVGVGRAVNGDSIYNGADDDASGTAAMLEIARRLASGPAPRRTVVFAAMTGEEVGLIGTRWYINNPPFPLERTVANLNLEMLARPDSVAGGPGRAWLTGYERSTMADIFQAAGVPVIADPRPEQNFFERSDNIAFARLGIVAHTLSSFGLHRDYHQPSDELATVDPAHFAAVVAAAVQATRALADGETPVWKPGGRPAPR